jgi:hydroxymethylpyrimidine pyrophosphatase-like HAD family hydrolase
MIEWAGLGYAVEGAPPEVVAAAGGRTIGKPGSAGVAWMVEQLLAG